MISDLYFSFRMSLKGEKNDMDSVNEEKNIGTTVVDLKTGRSLDAEVAEKVMGRRVAWSAAIYGDWMDRTSGRDDVYVARYSSDIKAAMEVVENLIGPYCRVLTDQGGERLPLVEVRRLDGDGWRYVARVEAETLPLAICRAALKATECLSISEHGTEGQAS